MTPGNKLDRNSQLRILIPLLVIGGLLVGCNGGPTLEQATENLQREEEILEDLRLEADAVQIRHGRELDANVRHYASLAELEVQQFENEWTKNGENTDLDAKERTEWANKAKAETQEKIDGLETLGIVESKKITRNYARQAREIHETIAKQEKVVEKARILRDSLRR